MLTFTQIDHTEIMDAVNEIFPKYIRQSLHFSKQPHPVIISFVLGALIGDFGEVFKTARFRFLVSVPDCQSATSIFPLNRTDDNVNAFG